ncbi:MAG: hypothetical protein QOD99_1858 [Chthoniobacter sp.]|jgi:hypothetical protein|nr:hypothetical protein [Chthoniobacter sp.]
MALALWLGIFGNSGMASTEDQTWKFDSRSNGIEFYSRPRAGSSIREFKAVSTIDAAANAIQNVLDDRDAYPRFMPYVRECRVISHEGTVLIAYQHLAPPFVSERDYTVRLEKQILPATAGGAYRTRWVPANDAGPPERPGIVRVKINEGSWLIEPLNANASRATYCIYTDSGGTLPAFIANRANVIAIGKLFDAIRKQVKDPKYTSTR